MPDTLSRNIYRALFSDDQWDLIYAMAGHALDNDDFTPEDVYSIRNKIHSLFDYNDWYLFFCWRWCDSSRTGRRHLHRHHTGAMLHSLLQFSSSQMKFQVTEIEFDFDDDYDEGWEGDPVPQQQIIDETIGQIWEADDEDDLVEEITCATGWCIKSLDYRHVLS